MLMPRYMYIYTSAVDLVHELCHSLANTDSELEPSVRHFSALVFICIVAADALLVITIMS